MSGMAWEREVDGVFSKELVWMGIFVWWVVSALWVAQEGEASSLLTIVSWTPAIRTFCPHFSAKGPHP